MVKGSMLHLSSSKLVNCGINREITWNLSQSSSHLFTPLYVDPIRRFLTMKVQPHSCNYFIDHIPLKLYLQCVVRINDGDIVENKRHCETNI